MSSVANMMGVATPALAMATSAVSVKLDPYAASAAAAAARPVHAAGAIATKPREVIVLEDDEEPPLWNPPPNTVEVAKANVKVFGVPKQVSLNLENHVSLSVPMAVRSAMWRTAVHPTQPIAYAHIPTHCYAALLMS